MQRVYRLALRDWLLSALSCASGCSARHAAQYHADAPPPTSCFLTLFFLFLASLSTSIRPQGLLFISALTAFETRTLYANSSGDHLVSAIGIPQ